MTRAPKFLRHVSGGNLLAGLLTIAALAVLALTIGLMSIAQKTDSEDRAQVESRVLTVLAERGLSDLSIRIDRAGDDIVSGYSAVKLVVWRMRGGDWQLHRTTDEQLASRLIEPPSIGQIELKLGKSNYLIERPDLEQISQDWVFPMSDVAVAFAFEQPGQAVRTARQVSIGVWAGLIIASVIGSILLASNRRRYADGIDEMNARLAAFSSGNTSVRLNEDVGAPELGDLARQLNDVLPRIDELIAGLRYLSANMAHELKTPLQVIRADLARLRTADDTQSLMDRAQDIDRTIDQANARLHALTQLFRLEAMADVVMKPFDLSLLVENAVDDLWDLLEENERTVKVEVDPDIIVEGNRPLIDLLFSNLLTNAAKYAPAEATIDVALKSVGTQFELTVSNTGSGFPDDIRLTAFERFSRAASDAEKPGTGIGLSLIRAIAQRHGFEASIADDPGRATVVIRGPRAE